MPQPSAPVCSWYQGWTVLGAMMAVQSFGSGFSACFTYYPWMETVDVPRSPIMLALMTTHLGMLLPAPFGRKAMDQFSTHRPVATGPEGKTENVDTEPTPSASHEQPVSRSRWATASPTRISTVSPVPRRLGLRR